MSHPKSKINKLLIVALAPEWSHLKSYFKFEQDSAQKNLHHIQATDHALLQLGVGPATAKISLENFLAAHQAKSILHFGSCGALVPELKCGEIFPVSCVTDGKEVVELRAHASKTLFTSHVVLKNKNQKQHAHQLYQAHAVDMESFAVARLCLANRIPYQNWRGVFDEVSDNLEAIGQPYDSHGNLNAAKLAVNLIKNPKLILSVPELKRRADVINQKLAAVIQDFLANSHKER